MSRIVASHVSKRYEGAAGVAATRALADFSLTVNDNEILCVVGPSGCGKSTFLNLVAGFIHPSQGDLTVNGKPVGGPGPDLDVVELIVLPLVRPLPGFGPGAPNDFQPFGEQFGRVAERRLERLVFLAVVTAAGGKIDATAG